MSDLGYLYVIEFQNGTIKVGRASDAMRRVAQHKATGAALGVPITRTWVSPAHENSEDTEKRLLEQLPESQFGREWFRDIDFVFARDLALNLTQPHTDAEKYNERLREAKELLEAHTGGKLRIVLPENGEANLEHIKKYFVFGNPDKYLLSSKAFSHYRQSGGQMTQKKFLLALDEIGVVRKRGMDGSRLYGIEIPTNM